jgi:hypothetical protein
MKKSFIAMLTASVVWGHSALAEKVPCIPFEDASNLAQLKDKDGDCDEFSRCHLPSLPTGWQWIREYEISYEEPQLWHWRSWPDEVQLKVCP